MDKQIERFVDANIFLEVLLKDKNWENAANYLNKLASGEINGLTSDFIVYSILLQIQEKKKSMVAMRSFITFLGNMKGLRILGFTPTVLMNAINIMDKYKLDFDDSLEAAFMEVLGIKEIVSFDKDFDKVKELKRVEPGSIID